VDIQSPLSLFKQKATEVTITTQLAKTKANKKELVLTPQPPPSPVLSYLQRTQ
jgi:hypothetical protein